MAVESISSAISFNIFLFENRFVKVIAQRNMPKMDLVGLSIGPFEEGREYEVRFWIARLLEEEGIVKIQDADRDEISSLHRIHFAERRASTPTQIPSDFYPRAWRLLNQLKSSSTKNAEKMLEYEHVRNLLRDIINVRVNKIIALALLQLPETQALKNLTLEEKALYEHISKGISEWRLKTP